MLAVLMSMKPEWWKKILTGDKVLEIRKTHPKDERLEWPVTVLVYASGTGARSGRNVVRPARGSAEIRKRKAAFRLDRPGAGTV